MIEYCRHEDCRQGAAADLLELTEATPAKRRELDVAFDRVWINEVRCRRNVKAKGRPGHHGTGCNAPLPGESDERSENGTSETPADVE